jgi:hypothetical protein
LGDRDQICFHASCLCTNGLIKSQTTKFNWRCMYGPILLEVSYSCYRVRWCMGMVCSVWFALIRTAVLKFLIILEISYMPCCRNCQVFNILYEHGFAEAEFTV